MDMKQQYERGIYLYVDPFKKDLRQLIHMESILGSNIAFTAKFDCDRENPNGDVRVNKLNFEIYPMSSLLRWGFKRIEPQVELDPVLGKRIIKVVLGFNNADSTCEVVCKNICWGMDEIIDNKIYFDVFGMEIGRDQLGAELAKYGLGGPKIEVPVEGRPCQFKLVESV